MFWVRRTPLRCPPYAAALVSALKAGLTGSGNARLPLSRVSRHVPPDVLEALAEDGASVRQFVQERPALFTLQTVDGAVCVASAGMPPAAPTGAAPVFDGLPTPPSANRATAPLLRAMPAPPAPPKPQPVAKAPQPPSSQPVQPAGTFSPLAAALVGDVPPFLVPLSAVAKARGCSLAELVVALFTAGTAGAATPRRPPGSEALHARATELARTHGDKGRPRCPATYLDFVGNIPWAVAREADPEQGERADGYPSTDEHVVVRRSMNREVWVRVLPSFAGSCRPMPPPEAATNEPNEGGGAAPLGAAHPPRGAFLSPSFARFQVPLFDHCRLARFLHTERFTTIDELVQRWSVEAVLSLPLPLVVFSAPERFLYTESSTAEFHGAPALPGAASAAPVPTVVGAADDSIGAPRVMYVLPEPYRPQPSDRPVEELSAIVDDLTQKMFEVPRHKRMSVMRRRTTAVRKLYVKQHPFGNVFYDHEVLAYCVYDALPETGSIDMLKIQDNMPPGARHGKLYDSKFFGKYPSLFVSFQLRPPVTEVQRAGLPLPAGIVVDSGMGELSDMDVLLTVVSIFSHPQALEEGRAVHVSFAANRLPAALLKRIRTEYGSFESYLLVHSTNCRKWTNAFPMTPRTQELLRNPPADLPFVITTEDPANEFSDATGAPPPIFVMRGFHVVCLEKLVGDEEHAGDKKEE